MDAKIQPFKKGMIILWSGSVASIPGGWALCNGGGDTPDLRDRFVVGAGNTYAVDATGGSLTHTHSFTGGGHEHTLDAGSDIGSGVEYSMDTASTQAAGTTNSDGVAPPYFALAYIMKL